MEQGQDKAKYADSKAGSKEITKAPSLEGKFLSILDDSEIASVLGPVLERAVPGFVETGVLTQTQADNIMESSLNARHDFTRDQRQVNFEITGWMRDNGLLELPNGGSGYNTVESRPYPQRDSAS